jgi:hypothetical protein
MTRFPVLLVIIALVVVCIKELYTIRVRNAREKSNIFLFVNSSQYFLAVIQIVKEVFHSAADTADSVVATR